MTFCWTKNFTFKTLAFISILCFFQSSGAQTLKSLADEKGKYIGNLMRNDFFADPLNFNNGNTHHLASTEFNTLVVGNKMKMSALLPNRPTDPFNIQISDIKTSNINTFVSYANTNNMRKRGHVMVWYKQIPSWLENDSASWTAQQVYEFAESYIKVLSQYTAGDIDEWDVLNEAVFWNGSKFTFRTGTWYDVVNEQANDAGEIGYLAFFANLFKWARSQDPNVQLFYNDYGIERYGLGKTSFMISMVNELKEDYDTPIDGVGLQSHFTLSTINDDPDFIEKIGETMDALGEDGFIANITELDIRMCDGDETTLEQQRIAYKGIVATALSKSNCNTVLIWGMSDNDSWIPIHFPGCGSATLYDETFQQKPAYLGVQEALQELKNTFSGATDNDWNTLSNWSYGSLPTSTTDVAIPAGVNPIIDSSTGAEVNDLIVDAAATLNIASGGSLIVNGTSSGKITYNQNLETENWYLISAPVVGETYDDAYVTSHNIATNENNNALATYLTEGNSWDYMQAGGGGTFIPGTAYAVRRATDQGAGLLTFSGSLNTDASGVDVPLSTESDRYNLIGNPYPSHLASTVFLENEAAISETKTLWVWNESLGDYGAYEVKIVGQAFDVAPGQGFFVKANSAGGTFNFDKLNQASSGGTFQKETADAFSVKLTISNGKRNNYCTIYYLPGSTTGFNVGYEGELFSGTSNTFAIYTHLVADSDGKNYQVQSLPNYAYENMIIPVGINAVLGTAITITASTKNLPQGLNLYIEDKESGRFTLLDSASSFTTTLVQNYHGIGRFYLHTSPRDLSSDEVVNSTLNIHSFSNESLRIEGVQNEIATIQLFTILGQEVLNASFQGTTVNDIDLPNLANGAYVIKITSEGGTLTKKIVIR